VLAEMTLQYPRNGNGKFMAYLELQEETKVYTYRNLRFLDEATGFQGLTAEESLEVEEVEIVCKKDCDEVKSYHVSFINI